MKDIPVLEVRNITKRFPGVVALDRVNLAVRRHEIHALLGENGAGKSTLMKIISGAYQEDEGEILVEGKPVKITHPSDSMMLGISIIYQDLNLIPDLSVAENIFFGRLPRKGYLYAVDFPKIRKSAQDLLSQINAKIDPTARVDFGVDL